MKAIFLIVAFLLTSKVTNGQWVKQSVNTTASFRGLSVVSEKIIWASGTGGTVIKTVDGGKHWTVMTVPGAEKLDFRDIEAFDANTAYILSIGNGESSRLYKTTDGGRNWGLQFKNTNEKAFFDALACMSRKICMAMSDPVDGHFLLIFTSNGGHNWRSDNRTTGQPAANEGEAAFAASGTCLIHVPPLDFMIVSGGRSARVLRGRPPSDFGGYIWLSADPHFVSGSSGSGIFSIAMLDAKNGVIAGGNYEKPDEHSDNLAFTTDGGESWKLAGGLTGYRSGVTYVDKQTIIAVGTNGSDMTRDGGKIWKKVGTENLNAVQAKGKRALWAVGPAGIVCRMDLTGNSGPPSKTHR
jgi:photosystem II stability/assembly factor-like uncharacterized protein